MSHADEAPQSPIQIKKVERITSPAAPQGEPFQWASGWIRSGPRGTITKPIEVASPAAIETLTGEIVLPKGELIDQVCVVVRQPDGKTRPHYLPFNLMGVEGTDKYYVTRPYRLTLSSGESAELQVRCSAGDGVQAAITATGRTTPPEARPTSSPTQP